MGVSKSRTVSAVLYIVVSCLEFTPLFLPLIYWEAPNFGLSLVNELI